MRLTRGMSTFVDPQGLPPARRHTSYTMFDPNTSARPLNILIVGAGIGGLTAALGLRKNGHNVTVYEQSKLATEFGAAVMLSPNAHGIFQRFGLDPVKDGAVLAERASRVCGKWSLGAKPKRSWLID